MKNRMHQSRNSLSGLILAATFLSVALPAQADSEPIRQPQQQHLLGYSARVGDRWHLRIGGEAGLLTNARTITKQSHATPDFVIEGPPYTTTPAYQRDGNAAPNNFGVAGDTMVRIFVRINNTYIPIDPFVTPRANAPYQVQRARRQWLQETGLVGAARIVRRVDLRNGRVNDLSMQYGSATYAASYASETDQQTVESRELPTPRATIEINPEMLKQQRVKETPAVEASTIESGVDSNERPVLGITDVTRLMTDLAASINGTISVEVAANDDADSKDPEIASID